MIIFKRKGSIFECGATILVNPINCIGVMGKGLALVFKQRYPLMFKHYKGECDKGNIHIGRPYIYYPDKTITIYGLPTKIDWRDKSELEYIEKGLTHLRGFLQGRGKSVISIPAIGCGNGQLQWEDVKHLISNWLSKLPDSQIYVFEPQDT